MDIFAKDCPEVDIYGTNAYRGKEGFGGLWKEVRDLADKPVIITEYGCPAYYEGKSQEVAEEEQAKYHRGCWLDIERNMANMGSGNSLGGIIFEWMDEWWN